MSPWFFAAAWIGVATPTMAMSPHTTPPALTTGKNLYRSTCAYCHGDGGQGGVRLAAPRLWGTGNILQHSAYSRLPALSRFIQQYMPLRPVNGVSPGSLTPAQAQSLARYIKTQQHP